MYINFHLKPILLQNAVNLTYEAQIIRFPPISHPLLPILILIKNPGILRYYFCRKSDELHWVMKAMIPFLHSLTCSAVTLLEMIALSITR